MKKIPANRGARRSRRRNPSHPKVHRPRGLCSSPNLRNARRHAVPGRTTIPLKTRCTPTIAPAIQPIRALCVIPQAVQPKSRWYRNYIRLFTRAAGMAGSLMLALVVLFFGATTIASYGPSPTARDLFVSTVMETSAAKFLAHMYFDDAQIQAILAGDAITTTFAITTASAVTTAAAVATAPPITAVAPTTAVPPTTAAPQKEEFDANGIIVEDVHGNTFVGKMMIVDDPARIFVKTLPTFDANNEGMELSDMIAESDAIAGINAGGFLDPNGMGRGGMPMGVAIHGGKLLCETATVYPTIVGFDAQYKLVAGNFSSQEALAMGIQEAVSFGPVLVSGGKVLPLSGGLNPRTAIGQRADGSVLLLVIDGRQPHSLGATYSDIANLMLQYGAVNAANLDGGSSSLMIYDGKTLNAYSMLTGPRKLPTAFLVKRSEATPHAAP